MGDILPVEISIYDDRSFDFIIKTPPTAFLLKKYAKVNKGSVSGSKQIFATISKDQLKEIAEIKLVLIYLRNLSLFSSFFVGLY